LVCNFKEQTDAGILLNGWSVLERRFKAVLLANIPGIFQAQVPPSPISVSPTLADFLFMLTPTPIIPEILSSFEETTSYNDI
jgi:hypothetical protein